MATVPVPRTWTNGEFVTDTIMNGSTGIRDALNFLKDPPRARIRQTTLQSLTNNVSTALNFQTEDFDNDAIHDPASVTRLTCKTAGTYQLWGACSFVGNATGRRGLKWQVNGVDVPASQIIQPAAAASGLDLSARVVTLALVVNDFVELCAFQDSGGALNTSVTSPGGSSAEMRWIGP